MRFFKDNKPKYTIEYNEAVEFIQLCHKKNNYILKEKDLIELTKEIEFDGDIIGYIPNPPYTDFTFPVIDRTLIQIFNPTGYLSINEGWPSSFRFTISNITSKGKYSISIDCSNSVGYNLEMDVTTQINEEVQHKVMFRTIGYSYNNPSYYTIQPKDTIKAEDIFKLCNVLYHADITKIYESVHNHTFPSFAKQLIIEAEEKEKKSETTHNEIAQTTSSNTPHKIPNDRIEEIYKILVKLESKGIQLSSEQENFVKMYNDRKEKLKKYNEIQPEIAEKQKQLKEKIASENERKYAWWTNPENPSNLHKNELYEKIAEAESEIRELEEIQSVGFTLTPHQEHLLEGYKLFIQNAMSEDRDIVQNMDQRAIEWYQEEYKEGKARK